MQQTNILKSIIGGNTMNKAVALTGAIILSVTLATAVAYAEGAQLSPVTTTRIEQSVSMDQMSIFVKDKAKVTILAASSFTDTKGHWAERSIANAVTSGYVDGYEDGSFKPEQSVSRAEFIKMLILGAFKDNKLIYPAERVFGDEWYAPYTAAAKDVLVKESDGLGTDWNKPMTRLEMARVAERSAKPGENNDVESKWMFLTTSNGLIQGMDSKGTLAPDGVTTRAQAITIIERVKDLLAGKKLEVDKYAMSNAEIAWHKTNVLTYLPEYFGNAEKQGKQFVDNTKVYGAGGMAEAIKFVVVDLDDVNDPNRALIGNDWGWTSTSDGKKVTIIEGAPSNAFALISVVEAEFNNDVPFTLINPDLNLDLRGLNSQGKPNVDGNGALIYVTGFAQMWKDSETGAKGINSGVVPVPAGEYKQTIITGQLLPKELEGFKGLTNAAIMRNSSMSERNVPALYSSQMNITPRK
jgi:hypothetical protein